MPGLTHRLVHTSVPPWQTLALSLLALVVEVVGVFALGARKSPTVNTILSGTAVRGHRTPRTYPSTSCVRLGARCAQPHPTLNHVHTPAVPAPCKHVHTHARPRCPSRTKLRLVPGATWVLCVCILDFVQAHLLKTFLLFPFCFYMLRAIPCDASSLSPPSPRPFSNQ